MKNLRYYKCLGRCGNN